METQQALEILCKLAEGCHPISGRRLSSECVFRDARVVRALHLATQALASQSPKQRPRKPLPRNAGKPWNEEEDIRLKNELRSGLSLEEIAISHDRRLGSVIARLLRLNSQRPQSQRL
jgi:hypothetical protein